MKLDYFGRDQNLFMYKIIFLIGIIFSTLSEADQKSMVLKPYYFSSIVEYDKSRSIFFGRIKVDKKNYFASIASDTGKMVLLKELPYIDNFYRGASALDSEKGRFFFIASLKRETHLFIIDITNGNVIGNILLPYAVKNIVFDPVNKLLLGITRFSGQSLISIDIPSGHTTSIANLDLIQNTGSGALMEGNNFIFSGLEHRKHHLYSLDIKTGILNKAKNKSIGLNEYTVISFEKNKNIDTLFTTGVQSCTAIAGYDLESNVGFIAHFTPTYKKIESDFKEIEKKIRTLTSKRGLKNMKFVVLGGVKGKQDSIDNLTLVYSQLSQYGIRKSEIRKFNSGGSYTVAIYNKKTKIF